MNPPLYLTRIDQVPQLHDAEIRQAERVAETFAFRTNDYYQSLIDWSDPDDPIRRIIMPTASELSGWGNLDASDEASFTAVRGLEHKYPSTALLLVTDICGGYCRFCFRKRLFMDTNDESALDIREGLAYIRAHDEISNVLLTGGDPLVLSAKRLDDIVRQLVSIPHVRVIRIGTKMVAFDPQRISGDPALLETIADVSTRKQVYIMAHFNHPRELTTEALAAVASMRRAGAVVLNQTPIIRGVNDTVNVLSLLFDTLSFNGIPPYYVFQCRPTLGNEPFALPLEQAYAVFEAAQSRGSGLAKSARFVMSHVSGKIEVLALARGHLYMRYHQAARQVDVNRFLVFRSNTTARWLDDYSETASLSSPVSDNDSRA